MTAVSPCNNLIVRLVIPHCRDCGPKAGFAEGVPGSNLASIARAERVCLKSTRLPSRPLAVLPAG